MGACRNSNDQVYSLSQLACVTPYPSGDATDLHLWTTRNNKYEPRVLSCSLSSLLPGDLGLTVTNAAIFRAMSPWCCSLFRGHAGRPPHPWLPSSPIRPS